MLTGSSSPRYALLRSLKASNRPKKAWWPEEAAFSAELEASWRDRSADIRREVGKAFDWSAGTVDAHQAVRALDGVGDVSRLWVEDTRPEIERLIGAVSGKSEKTYARQADKITGSTKTKAGLLDWLIRMTVDQVELFMLRHADRILLPELERLVQAFQAGAAANTLDIGYFQERLDRVMQQEAYLQGLSSYYTARTWNAQAILLAEQKGIATFMIVNPLDKLTCPVCMHLYGKTYDVKTTLARVQRELAITDADQLKQEFPFPRLRDVDNIPWDELQRKGFDLPPYHNRCRCEVLYLGTSDIHETMEVSVI